MQRLTHMLPIAKVVIFTLYSDLKAQIKNAISEVLPHDWFTQVLSIDNISTTEMAELQKDSLD